MDNQRPHLDLKYYREICPDKTGASLLLLTTRAFVTAFSNTIISPKVPVIAVFTKYDQFLRNVKIHLEDYGNPGDIVSAVAEKQFQEHYLQPLGDSVSYVQLESEFSVNSRC